MRNPKDLLDIATQLCILEDISRQFQILIADVNIVLQKGKLWIKEEDNQPYVEIKEYLNKETSECIRRYYSIASDVKGKLTESNLIKERENKSKEMVTLDTFCSGIRSEKDSKVLIEKLDELTLQVVSQSELIKTLQHKLKDVEKERKTISKQKQETNDKNNETFGDNIEELHAIEDVSSKVEVCLQTVNLFEPGLLEKLNNAIKRLIEELATSEISSFKIDEAREQQLVENKVDEIKELTDKLSYNCKKKKQSCMTNKAFEEYKQKITLSIKDIVDISHLYKLKHMCYNCNNKKLSSVIYFGSMPLCFDCWKKKIVMILDETNI